MSVNQFTLNNLYNQGIIDYVPYDLLCGSAVPQNTQMYMNSAMQGAMYQNYGASPDSFSRGMIPNNNITYDAFGGIYNGGGESSQFNNSSAGMNAFGGINGNTFVNNSQAGMNSFGGGLGRLGNQASSLVNSVPNVVKGFVSGALILGTAILCLKGKKKPAAKDVQQSGFMNKLMFWKKK